MPDLKNNFNFERSQGWNDFCQFWGLCDTEQPPISGNNPTAGRLTSKLCCGAQKNDIWPQAHCAAAAATL